MNEDTYEILADQFVILRREERKYLISLLNRMESIDTPVAEWMLQRGIVSKLEEAGE